MDLKWRSCYWGWKGAWHQGRLCVCLSFPSWDSGARDHSESYTMLSVSPTAPSGPSWPQHVSRGARSLDGGELLQLARREKSMRGFPGRDGSCSSSSSTFVFSFEFEAEPEKIKSWKWSFKMKFKVGENGLRIRIQVPVYPPLFSLHLSLPPPSISFSPLVAG